MPFSINDSTNPADTHSNLNLIQSLNTMAFILKKITGQASWKIPPSLSLGEVGAGAKGDTGAAGAQGIQGAKGDKGDTGAAGVSPSLTPEAWQDLVLATNWSQSSTATAQYRKLLGNLIEVKGLITKSSALVAGEVVATLPAGFRPTQIRYFICYGSNSYSRIQLDPTGQIKVTIAGSNFSAGLDFIFGLG